MVTIYAETERLRLRAWEKNELQRCTDLIGEWDIAKWLTRVPHPYSLSDAEWWYEKMEPSYRTGEPELFTIANKNDNLMIGAIGLHPPNVPEPEEGNIFLGYWLGKPYWGRGFMSEAVAAILPLGFARPSLKRIAVSTDIDNKASQNVLRKAGFNYLGIGPRIELGCLRGSLEVTRWEMTRGDFEGLHSPIKPPR